MKRTYYIQSGALREAVVAENPEEAFKCAFMRALEKEPPALGMLTMCSIHGFHEGEEDEIYDDDIFTLTERLLRESGLIDSFHIESPEEPDPDDIYPC